jgi:hypothetical protein
MSVDIEESKTEMSADSASPFRFNNETKRVAYQDDLLTVYPLKAVGKQGEVCYSYIGLPAMGKAKFLPKNAKDLGCDPKKHNKLLYEGQSVTLDNGTVVTPGQVTEPAEAAQAFILVFLPDETYI